jgi:hypothetical protein
MPQQNAVTVRVIAPGHGLFQDLRVAGASPTVNDALEVLARREVDYNGVEIAVMLNGVDVTNNLDRELVDEDSIVIIPDKPSGN